MKKLSITLTLVVAMLAGAGAAKAQVYPGAYYGPVIVPYPVTSYHHASTAAEGYLRGGADVIRARAYYNMLTSHAMINVTEAHRRAMENQVRKAETFHRVRQVGLEAQAARRAARRSHTASARQVNVTRPAPQAPSAPEVLELRGGRIVWPTALQGDHYAAFRTAVERAFEPSAGDGGIVKDRALLTHAVRNMAGTLKQHVREVSPMDYVAAKRFLATLATQAG